MTSTVKVQLPRNQFFGNPFLPGTEIQQSLGSGFVIDKAGHIVTNYHVVERAQSVQVSFSNSEAMTATIVGSDPSTDVALLGSGELPGPEAGRWVTRTTFRSATRWLRSATRSATTGASPSGS